MTQSLKMIEIPKLRFNQNEEDLRKNDRNHGTRQALQSRNIV